MKQLSQFINEAKATYCGRCGTTHVPPAKGGTPPTTQSRTMLQQLFPNDAITGAAAMQGGAPPMPG